MLVRAFSIMVLWLTLITASAVNAANPGAPVPSEQEPLDPPPTTVFNEFYPEERPLSDCLSSLPKPDCGSEARGGWRQITILGAVVGALGFIAWRIVRASRRARASRAPAATSAPGDAGAARGP